MMFLGTRISHSLARGPLARLRLPLRAESRSHDATAPTSLGFSAPTVRGALIESIPGKRCGFAHVSQDWWRSCRPPLAPCAATPRRRRAGPRTNLDFVHFPRYPLRPRTRTARHYPHPSTLARRGSKWRSPASHAPCEHNSLSHVRGNHSSTRIHPRSPGCNSGENYLRPH